MVIVMVMTIGDQVSLATAKAHLSEVVDGVETDHRRVVITKHGRPSAIVLSVDDLEALEATLDLLADQDALEDLREAARARATGAAIELTKEQALARWADG